MAHFRDLVLLAALAVVGTAQPARAETCLERFSCHLHGECRLPCFGDDEATSQAATAATSVSEGSPSSEAVNTGLKPIIVSHKARTQHPAIVRVVASKTIQTLDDLRGKPVSFGLHGTRFQALARRALLAAGIKVQEIPLDLDNALDGVGTGDIAAVVVLGERNVKKLARLATKDLHLLTVPAPNDRRPAISPRAEVAKTAIRPVLASAR